MFICFAKVVYVLKMSNASKLRTVKFKNLLVLANSWNHKNLRPIKHFQRHQLLSIAYFYNKNNTFPHYYILQLSQQTQEITKFLQCQIWVAQAFGKLPFQHLSYLKDHAYSTPYQNAGLTQCFSTSEYLILTIITYCEIILASQPLLIFFFSADIS